MIAMKWVIVVWVGIMSLGLAALLAILLYRALIWAWLL